MNEGEMLLCYRYGSFVVIGRYQYWSNYLGTAGLHEFATTCL